MSTADGATSLDADGRADQAARLLINPEPGWVLNYTVMATLAALIAGLGMRLDSAPIVIGAMLVAPVMRPVLGLGFSCLTPVPLSALRRLFVVLGATSVGLVAIGWLLSVLVPSTEVALAGEVLARTAPDIRDLLVALAAGAVGAFAIMRPRVGDTITGVAIAVALVPPPVAAGIALGESFGPQARGALLLYGTNLVAIIFGTVVTVLALRLVGERPFELSRTRLARATATVVTLGLVLGIPLAGSFFDAVDQAQRERDEQTQEESRQRLQRDAEVEIQAWIDTSTQPNLEIVTVTVPLDVPEDEVAIVAVVLLGQDDSYIPALAGLDTSVSDALDRPVEVGLRLVGVADQVSSTLEVASGPDDVDDADDDARRRDLVGAAVLEWAGAAGVPARLDSISTLESGTLSIRLALAGATPSTADLNDALFATFGDIPPYELIINELVLSPPTLRSAAVQDATANAAVDGRQIEQLDVCRTDGDVDRFRLSSETGAELVVDADSMQITAGDGETFIAEAVDIPASVEPAARFVFIATFDRASTALGEVVITITGMPPPC